MRDRGRKVGENSRTDRNAIGNWDRMGYRGLLLCVTFFLLLCFLMGCQLARPEGDVGQAAEGAGQDRLVGVYVTREHLDFFDMEAYLQDHLDQVLKDGDHLIQDGAAYEGRLYAKLVTRTSTGEDGRTHQHQEYVFEDLEGMGLYSVFVDSEEGGYHTSQSGDGISDVHVGYHTKDEGEDISLEGVIYVAAGARTVQQGDTVFYFNPVYQTADGQVYLMSGSGLGGMSLGGAGASMSHKMNGTVTIQVDGEEKTYGCDVNVTIESVYAPEKMIVHQMSEENIVLTKIEYIPGQLPNSLEVESETAYLLVETWQKDEAGQWIVERSICQSNEKTLSVLYDRGDGICQEDFLDIQWPNEKDVR